MRHVGPPVDAELLFESALDAATRTCRLRPGPKDFNIALTTNTRQLERRAALFPSLTAGLALGTSCLVLTCSPARCRLRRPSFVPELPLAHVGCRPQPS